MFFTHLNQVLGQGVDLHLTVSKTETGMIVLVMPKVNGLKDPAQNHIVPLRFAGTAEQIDANFLPSIAQPVQTASGILVSMAQFEQQAEKAAANSKAAKELKDKDAKEAKEKKEKCDSHMKKAEEQEAAGDLDAALLSLKQAKLHATDKTTKSVDEKIAAIRAQQSQGSLFDVPVSAPQPQPVPVQQAIPQQQQVPVQQAIQPQPMQAAPVQHQQAQPVQQPQPIAAPVQQQPYPEQAAPPQPAGIQPNTQGFGMFGQQVQQPAQAIPQQPAPHGVNHEIMPYSNQPNLAPSAATSACSETEYAEYPDFPPEMIQPAFTNHMTIQTQA